MHRGGRRATKVPSRTAGFQIRLMIVSHQHRFIFVKGTKVGGTSVEMALSAICGPDDIVTPVTPVDDKPRIERGNVPRNYALRRATEIDYARRIREATPEELDNVRIPMTESRFFNHMPLARAERMLGPAVDAYTVVCVERNPYEKVISLANWFMQAPEYHHGRAMKFDPAVVKSTVDRMIANGFILRCKNIGRYRRRRGELSLRVLRFDSLADDFADFVRDLGVRDNPPTLPHAKKGNYKARPLELLAPNQIAAINELFRDEFAFFGYPVASSSPPPSSKSIGAS